MAGSDSLQGVSERSLCEARKVKPMLWCRPKNVEVPELWKIAGTNWSWPKREFTCAIGEELEMELPKASGAQTILS